MKSTVAFFAVKKLTGANIVLVAARHNKRELQAEIGASHSIDATRSSLNQCLVGPHDAAGVAGLAKARMMAAGVLKTRRDAVLCIEAVFSLPPGHSLDGVAYFRDCTAWAGDYFAGAEILTADIHRDEAAPHCHVLILPLVDGRMTGSGLMGGKAQMMAMTKQFHAEIAAKHGLVRAPKRTRTMAEIFTSPGKGPRTEKIEPYRVCTPKNDRTLSCVGFASNTPPAPATDSIPPAWIDAVIEQLEAVIERAVQRAVTATFERKSQLDQQARAPPPALH